MGHTAFPKARTARALLLAALAASVACEKLPGLRAREKAEPPTPAATTKNDDGSLTATVDPNSSTSQVVTGDGNEDLSGVQVILPAGSLAATTDELVLAEGTTIADDAALASLGVEGNEVATTGTPVLVDGDADLAGSGTLVLPLPAASSLQDAAVDVLLVVFYRIEIKATGAVLEGIIPGSELKPVEGGVEVKFQYFGIYQTAYMKKAVQERVEKPTEAVIQTRHEEEQSTATATDTPTVADTKPLSLDKVPEWLGAAAKGALEVAGDCGRADANVEIRVDGKAAGSGACSNERWRAALKIDGDDGARKLTVGYKGADFGEKPPTATITLDTKAPTLTLDDVVPIKGSFRTAWPVSGTCAEVGRTVRVVAKDGTKRVEGSVACAATGWRMTLDASALADGAAIALEVWTSDAAGNSTIKTAATVKDVIAPTLSIDPLVIAKPALLAAWHVKGTCTENSRTVNVTVTGADGSSVALAGTCAANKFDVALDITSLPDGALAVTAQTTDPVGNATTKTASSRRDTVPPTVTLNAIGVYIATPTITVTGTCEGGSGNVTVSGSAVGASTTTATIPCTAGGNWSTSMSVTAFGEGALITIVARQSDAATNLGTSTSRTTTKDTTPPSITLSQPADISTANVGGSVSVSGTCAVNAMPVEVAATDGVGEVTATGTCNGTSWTATLAPLGSLTDGGITVRAAAFDDAGNEGSATKTLTKDVVAPVVTITAPSVVNNANKSTYTVSGTCAAGDGSVSISVADPTPVTVSDIAVCNGGSWTKSLDVTSLADSGIAITASQTDAVGNAGSDGPEATTKDTSNPSLTLLGPTEVLAPVTTASFSGSCSENGRTVTVEVGDGANPAVSGTGSCTVGAWGPVVVDISSLDFGPLTADASLDDASDNEITIDMDFPFIDSLTVTSRFAGVGDDWLDWVNTASAATSPSACDPNNDQASDACFHAGEMRAVEVPSETSCASLTISDSLSAFYWSCEFVAALGHVRFTSKLKPVKSLSDLITWTTGPIWRPNSVEVQRGGDVIGRSLSTSWWNAGQLEPLPTGGGTTTTLGTPGTIYVFNVSVSNSFGYEITADSVGIVALGLSTLTGGSSLPVNCATVTGGSVVNKCLIWSHGAHYTYVSGKLAFGHSMSTGDALLLLSEGSFLDIRNLSLATTKFGVFTRALKYSKLRNVTVTSPLNTGIRMVEDSSFNRLVDVRVGNGANDGVYVGASTGNVLQRVTAVNNNTNGINLAGADDTTVVEANASSNAANGIEVNGSLRTVLNAVVVGLNGMAGLHLNASDGATTINVVAYNNTTSGINSEAAPGLTHEFYDVASGLNGTNAVLMNYGTHNFHGSLIAAVDGSNCATYNGALTNVDGDCTKLSGADFTAVDASGLLSAPFAGSLASPSSLGSVPWSLLSPTVTYAINGNLLSATASRGRCTVSCDKYSWTSQSSGGNPIHALHGTFTPGDSCPASVDGSEVVTVNGSTFLRNAVEVPGDGHGNDNGRCESNEACTFLHQPGSALGNSLPSAPCFFEDGAVVNASISSVGP